MGEIFIEIFWLLLSSESGAMGEFLVCAYRKRFGFTRRVRAKLDVYRLKFVLFSAVSWKESLFGLSNCIISFFISRDLRRFGLFWRLKASFQAKIHRCTRLSGRVRIETQYRRYSIQASSAVLHPPFGAGED